MSFILVRYVIVAALRDKLLLSMLLAYAVASSLALFFAGSAVVEKDQFTLVLTASSLRLITVLGLVLFTVFFVRRSFESKDIEFLLSRPLSRVCIILSYAVAFIVISVFAAFSAFVVLYAVAPHLFTQAHLLWFVSLALEGAAMVSVAFFFSMQISSAASASMLTLAVYVLGRLMGQLLGIVDSALVDSQGLYAMALQLVSVITPRLDLLAQTSWLIYGIDWGALVFSFFQVFVFVLLVVAAACLDFMRRQF